MAFGEIGFGEVAFGESAETVTRIPLQHYRTLGSDPPTDLAFGELGFVDGTDTILMGKSGGSLASFRDEAHNAATYQPLDADLTGLAGLSTTGFVQRTGAGSFSAGSLSSGDIPDLSASYAPASLVEMFSGVGSSGTDGTTSSTSFTRINHTISGQNGIQYTNSSGRTKTVLARVACSVSCDGTHTAWFRLNATGTGVTVTRNGGVRTPSANYVPATLEILLTVTTGNTVTIFIEAEVGTGGTAYLVETGDGIWTMIGQAIG